MASTDYITTGGGKLYIQTYDNGVLNPDMAYFGITDDITLSSDTEQIEHSNTETSVQRTDKKVAKKKNASISFTTAEISPEMLALAYLGTVSAIAQTIQTAVAAVITAANKGFFYDMGYVSITTLVVKDSTDLTTYVVGVDYNYDKNTGMLEVLAGGSCADADDLNLTVTADAYTKKLMASLTGTQLEARLVFVSDPQSGSKYRYTFKKVNLIATGDLALKSEDFATISFEGEALVDESVVDPLLSDYFDVEELPNA